MLACLFTVRSPYLSSGKGVNDGGQRLVDGWLSLLKGNYSSWGCVMAGPGMDGLGCGWFQLKPLFALQEFACCLSSCCLGGDGGVVGLYGVEVPVLRVEVFKTGGKRMERHHTTIEFRVLLYITDLPWLGWVCSRGLKE
jgi:hypothetical protein